MSEQITEDTVYIGIDVGKSWLDVFSLPETKAQRFPNDAVGIAHLCAALRAKPARLIVMEATGRWHGQAHEALSAAGFAVAVVNPYRTRRFADALGVLAKSDAIDARVLALYAERIKPAATPPSSDERGRLKELIAARREAKVMLVQLSHRLGALRYPLLREQIRQQVQLLKEQMKVIEKEINALVRLEQSFQRSYRILTSIPGCGTVVATTLIADMAELGRLSRTQVAALVGVAPMNCDSGAFRGRRIIKGGRHHVRAALYMAALSAIRANADMRSFYKNLLTRGKKPKVALTAVMRKLIILANTLIKENRIWTPIHP